MVHHRQRWSVLALVVGLSFTLVGCVSGPPLKKWTRGEVAEVNSQRLLKVQLGMTQAEALGLMGTERFPGTVADYRYLVNTSPTNRELRNQDGRTPQAPPGAENLTLGNAQYQSAPLKNPLRELAMKSKDGAFFKVFFFYTGGALVQEDKVQKADLTPLTFKDGILVGIGWEFLEANARPGDLVGN